MAQHETTRLPPVPGSRRDGSRDRPTTEPGGCECDKCGCIFIGAEWHAVCAVCAEESEQQVDE